MLNMEKMNFLYVQCPSQTFFKTNYCLKYESFKGKSPIAHIDSSQTYTNTQGTITQETHSIQTMSKPVIK